MNKLIIGAVVVLALAGGGFFLVSQQNQPKQDAMMQKDAMKKDDAMMQKSDDQTMMQKDDAMMEKTDDKMMADAGSRYFEYTHSAYDLSADTKRVLFFYANWCPTCKPADANFTANASKIPEDVTLIRVNYNDTETNQEEKDLAKKYQVTYQHTFVQIDADGNVVTKWNGGQIDELLANVK